MVATAVMPVSMEPPTLAIGVNRTASIHDRLQERGSFAVNILSRWNHAMVRGFASASGEARFAHGVWSSHQSADAHVEGLPLLANAQASILCKIASASQVGTHTLFVAEVADVIYISDCNPLVYCDGNYGMVSSLPKTAEQMNRLGLMTAVA
jgi:flavin reductase (DIM6/NTAB) family NADH-FMN oxidoreductase RutF